MVLLSLMQIASTLIGSEIADSKGRRKMLLGGQTVIIFVLIGIFIFDKIIAPIFGTNAG